MVLLKLLLTSILYFLIYDGQGREPCTFNLFDILYVQSVLGEFGRHGSEYRAGISEWRELFFFGPQIKKPVIKPNSYA